MKSKETQKAPCWKKMHRVFTRNTRVTMSTSCRFTQNSSLGSFALFVLKSATFYFMFQLY